MKLAEALRLGYDCGMKTVDDCLFNVHLHAMNLFPYAEMNAEESELVDEFNNAVETYGISPTTSTEEAMDLLKVEYKPDVDTEAYPQCK